MADKQTHTHTLQVLFRLMFVLLAFTALAKLWQLVGDPFPDVRLGIPLWLVWASVAWEFAVCSILASGSATAWFKWQICFATFGLFFVASTFKLIWAFESCGCAGAIELPPWVTVCLNGALVVALLIQMKKIKRLPIHQAAIGENFVRGLAVGGAVLAFGLVTNFDLASLTVSGQSVNTERVYLGRIQLNQLVTAEAFVKNDSDVEIEVVGHDSSCKCLNAGSGRRKLSPGASEKFEIVVKPTNTGFFWQRVHYFLDSPQQPFVAVDIVGFVN